MTYKTTRIFYLFLFLVFSVTLAHAQQSPYSVDALSDSLTINADAVIRLSQIDVDIISQRSLKVHVKRAVTVLNENGLNDIGASCNYSKSSVIKSISALIYDAFGKEIKKVKRGDFVDISAVDGSTLFSNYRYMYLNYTPVTYPFTVVFEYESETSNTAFLPQWMPLNDYGLSVEKSMLNLTFPSNLGFKYKEFHFSNYPIVKTVDTSTALGYVATNLVAHHEESNSPSLSDLLPRLMVGLELFHLEGVDGNAKNWTEFGKWYNSQILAGTSDLPEATKVKIKALVGTETDPIKKAKIVYKYVQEKNRYVSIQIGIGGWKPMLASDVDRLGYGDCKALSNYTSALLAAVDVPSYKVILYGSQNKRNIESDFVSMQGNHMILAVPDGAGYVFLECTSQVNPFGYQAGFTDDRDVVVIKPEGGQIVRTKTYQDSDNAQLSRGSYVITENGDLNGEISIVSQGNTYNGKYSIEKRSATDLEKFYKDYWYGLSNLKLKKLSFKNEPDKISFTENVQIGATSYATVIGNKMMFTVNAFNPIKRAVKRSRNRLNPLEIQRGEWDVDDIEIALPANYTVEFLPRKVEFKGKFGEYQCEVIKKDPKTLVYKRSFLLKKGLYNKGEYEEYRQFLDQIGRYDNTKVIITKS